MPAVLESPNPSGGSLLMYPLPAGSVEKIDRLIGVPVALPLALGSMGTGCGVVKVGLVLGRLLCGSQGLEALPGHLGTALLEVAQDTPHGGPTAQAYTEECTAQPE